MTQMLSIYLSPDNNSDKTFEEQIYMGIKSRKIVSNMTIHGLRTPDEGINQRNLKFWANVADTICFAAPKNLGLGLNSWPRSEGYFLSGCL